MKRIIALTLAAFIALALLVSCGGESGNSNGNQGRNSTIVGKWQIDKYALYEFKENGTIEYTSYSSGGITYQGTYSISGDILSFSIDIGYTTDDYTGKYKLEDDRLYLYDNDACLDEYKPRSAYFAGAVFKRVE